MKGIQVKILSGCSTVESQKQSNQPLLEDRINEWLNEHHVDVEKITYAYHTNGFATAMVIYHPELPLMADPVPVFTHMKR